MTALQGTDEEIEALILEFIGNDTDARAAYDAKREEFTAPVMLALMRRLLLQVTDSFWLEHLETMDYLRRSVSLRAYGQRDPLNEYRREGLHLFQSMQESIRQAVISAMPRIRPADDARIRAEEEKVRAKLVAASEGGDGSAAQPAPIVKGDGPGRNDTVTIRNGDETRQMKYKKAEPLLAEGWELIS